MFQGKEWDTLMAGFSKDYTKKSSSQSEISSLFFQLGKIVDKKVACFWHADSFDRYRSKRILTLLTHTNFSPFG